MAVRIAATNVDNPLTLFNIVHTRIVKIDIDVKYIKIRRVIKTINCLRDKVLFREGQVVFNCFFYLF